MIATHAPKLFNSKLKVSALRARIPWDVPEHFVCSQNVNMRREFWAAPRSAGDLKESIKKANEIENNNYDFEPEFAEITDTQLKQVLLPKNWKNNEYVSTSPVPSMGVIHEIYRRVKEMNTNYKAWQIQPNSVAIRNHGEMLIKQRGAIRLLKRGVAGGVGESDWKGDFIQLTARCERMNISSGMVSVGFPALTAIGGYIHALERHINDNIEFAIGFKKSEWHQGLTFAPLIKTASALHRGRIEGKISIKEVMPGYITDEITATSEIVLLLRTKSSILELVKKLENTHRLAGGDLFDVEVKVVENGEPPQANYIVDASDDLSIEMAENDVDSLQAALNLYTSDGEWNNGWWDQACKLYTLNMTGYAYLEEPIERKGARKKGLHAWAEPIFSLIRQRKMGDCAWWCRKDTKNGVFWSGIEC